MTAMCMGYRIRASWVAGPLLLPGHTEGLRFSASFQLGVAM